MTNLGSLRTLVKKFKPTQMVAMGYFSIIALGTVLLMLPIASRSGAFTGFITAFFTAVSSACVTGLVVVDTFTHWSIFGQLVILLLVQIGGLGFMTAITLFSFALRKKIGLRTRSLIKESVNSLYIGGVVRLVKKIILVTITLEGIGALILALRFIPKLGFFRGLYFGIFHSVSAFCNAGFDLMGAFGEYSSLSEFNDDIIVLLTIMVLIIIGGIGFFVWDDLINHKREYRKYKLHTKIVLTVTSVLIISGTVLFYLFERTNTFSDMSEGHRLVNALFCSVTPRTAGFSTVEYASLNPASKFLTGIFMFIGGSPGSTSGGIKTTTIAVLLLSGRATLFHSKGCNVFGRRLEEDVLRKATSVFLVSASLIVFGVIAVSATNSLLGLDTSMFEVVSALGTVGLSTGATQEFNVFAQLILIILMYCGRVGSLTFALIFTETRYQQQINLPSEKISVG